MKLKFDEDGKVVLSEEGLPVWTLDDESEIAYDVPKVISDLQKANNESAGRRKKIEELEAKVKPFEGIDPEAAKTALETVKNFKDKELIAAGEVEQIKKATGEAYELKINELTKTYSAQIEDRDGLIKKKDRQINDLLIKGAFEASKFLKEKTTMPPDLANSHFGRYFTVEEVDGTLRTVASYNGERIYSNARPGQIADPEEAIEQLINKYPYKDSILKGAGGSGTGAFSPGSKEGEAPVSPAEMLYGKMTKK
jgi:hypothetical protein